MTAADDRRDRLDLPSRVVVGANGAFWRDYGTHYSMCPVSEDNDPVEIVAIYVRDYLDPVLDRAAANPTLSDSPALDVERLSAAMSEAFTYEDSDNGIPTLPFYDDFRAFWDPFAAKVAREYAALTDDAARGGER